jgi:alkylation response protein AidB-like acyl-CoA dehydrogenase
VRAALRHLTDEQRALLDEAAALGRDALAPVVAAGAPGRVNRPLVAALAAHGLLGRVLRPDASALELCLLREGLARTCTEAETALAVQGLGSFPLLETGGEVGELAAGRAVAAFALSEPEAGTDVAAMSLRGEPDGDGWRLTGVKTWISNAPDADHYTVFARTGEREISAFAVAGGSEGLRGEPLDMLAPHPIGRLEFDGVPARLVGEVGAGFRLAMRTLDRFRPSVGAAAVGMAQAALDLAVAHAARRRAFGRTLSEMQAVSHRLADVATEVCAARLLVHQAARAYDADEAGVSPLSAMAKLYATEAAQRAIDAAVQVHGARALVAGHPLEHAYREVRALRVYEGTSEIQREIIARSLFRG